MDGKEVRRHDIRVGDAVRVTRGGAHPAAHAPADNRLAREGRSMETHIPNRISTACEALNFISSYGRICEANNVKKPEMGGLARTPRSRGTHRGRHRHQWQGMYKLREKQ